MGELLKLFLINQRIRLCWMALLDEQYWTERYQKGNIGWDIGYPSTPIKEYVDQLEDKSVKILIPGVGNAYEAEYLWKMGFENITIIDLSVLPLQKFSKRMPDLAKVTSCSSRLFLS